MNRSDQALINAIREGNVDIVKRFIENENYIRNIDDYTYNACEYGQLKVLEYLLEKHLPINQWAIIYAAAKGHVNIIRFLHNIGYKFTRGPEACSEAAYNDHIECLKYLYTIPMVYDHDKDDSASAARNGSINVLEFLKDRDSISDKAWKTHNYESNVWLHKNLPGQCPNEECFHCPP